MSAEEQEGQLSCNFQETATDILDAVGAELDQDVAVVESRPPNIVDDHEVIARAFASAAQLAGQRIMYKKIRARMIESMHRH